MTTDLAADLIPTPSPDDFARLEGLRDNAIRIGKHLAEGRAAAAPYPLLANAYEAQVYRQMEVVRQIENKLAALRAPGDLARGGGEG